MSNDEVEIVVAHLTKLKGLGISLEGTVDVEGGLELRPRHYIRSILPEGPVGQNGQLNSGDELLEVNGQKLLGKSHVDVVKILRELPNAVRLVCARKHDEENRVINTSQDREAFEQRNIVGGSLKNLLYEPVTDKPVNDKPLTEQDRQVQEESVLCDETITDKPITHKPITDKPVTDKPLTDKPVADKLTTDQTLTNKPVYILDKSPSEDKTITEEPVTEKPQSEKPFIDKPFDQQDLEPRSSLLTKSLSDTSINTSSTATVTATTDDPSSNQQKPVTGKSRSLTNLAMWSEEVDIIDLMKTDRGLGK